MAQDDGHGDLCLRMEGSAPDIAYGFVLGAAIARGFIASIDATAATAAPGVIEVVTHKNAKPLGNGEFYVQRG